MNGQERLQAIHNKKPHDRAPLTTLVDGITRQGMSRELQEMSTLDFYKHLNYDIYQFGNYGLRENEAVKYPYKITRKNVQYKHEVDENGYYTHIRETPHGVLKSRSYRGHPTKYPVETIEDLAVLKQIWTDTEYTADFDGCGESYERLNDLLDGWGVYVPAVGPSAVQMLLEEDIGTKNFYYMLQDYPAEMYELIETIHDRRCQEYRLIAKHMPYDCCVTVENTSTTYISPSIYRQISQKHMKDFVDIMHGEGKIALLHMCGLVKHLLYDFIPTGLDGIHALTEPPIGDTFITDALDVLGEDLIVVTCLDSTKISNPDYTQDKFITHMEEFVTDRLKKANVIFGLPADGLETPLDRFILAEDWFNKNGYPKAQ